MIDVDLEADNLYEEAVDLIANGYHCLLVQKIKIALRLAYTQGQTDEVKRFEKELLGGRQSE